MPPIAAIPITIIRAVRIFFLIFDLGARLMSIMLHQRKFVESCNSLVERAAIARAKSELNELANKLHAPNYTVLRHGAIQSLCQHKFCPSLRLKCLKNKGSWEVRGRKVGYPFEKS